MVKLENIYVKEIVDCDTDECIIDLIVCNNAYSVQDVINLIKRYPQYNWQPVQRKINMVIQKLKSTNNNNVEPIIYKTSGYSDERMLKTDEMNNGEILPLYCVTNINTVTSYGTYGKSIKLIKEQLSHTVVSGENFFHYHNKRLGNKKIQKLISAIEIYENQVERQSKTTSNLCQNLFMLDIDEKKAIIAEHISDIALYLLKTAKKEFLWGSLNEQVKKEILFSLVGESSKDIQIRNNLITYVSSFLTLPEIKSGDEKVLNRFIIN